MKLLLHILFTLLFGTTFLFAAGDVGVVEGAAGGEGGDVGGGDVSDDGDAGEVGAESTEVDGEATGEEQASDEQQEERATDHKDEFKAYRGLASSRVRGLLKKAPELTDVFKKYPKVQEELEATFRRDAGYREVFPTLAEANQMRDYFPNGVADVQQMQADVQEVEALDKDFYTRDREGNYPGHAKIVSNMYQDDPKAAVALFRGMPKEWARLDRASYNEVMGQVVGATLASQGIPEFVGELLEAAKEAKQDGLVKGLTKLLNFAEGFTKEKARPSADEERLKNDRAQFERQTQEREREEIATFQNKFVAESRTLQQQIIKAHPAVKRLLESKTVTDGKKQEIVERIRADIKALLGKSPSFMRKITPAHQARNLQETLSLQKAAWSQQWLLNKMVRAVLNKEVPQMVSNNREAVRRRAGASAVKTSVKTGDQGKNASKAPTKIGGRWYRDGGKGAAFTTAEVIAGKHLL